LGASSRHRLLGTVMSTFFEHVVDQYPPEIRKEKYEYWAMLKQANEEYRQHNEHESFEDEKICFEQWMKDRWGVIVGIESDGYSPYYTVEDENKYLLFCIKYA
jgi:hypothetical protein